MTTTRDQVDETQMADPPSSAESFGDIPDGTGVSPAAERRPSTPRWVKVSGIIALLLVLLVVVLMLAGGGPGGHGPGRHTGSGGAGGQTPPSNVAPSGGAAGETPASSVAPSGGAAGHKPPAGGHTP